jgi:hypothetical protein
MQRQNVIARCAKSRQMPHPSVKTSKSGLGGIGVLVAERDVLVDEVADGLGPAASPSALAQPNSDSRSVSQ